MKKIFKKIELILVSGTTLAILYALAVIEVIVIVCMILHKNS